MEGWNPTVKEYSVWYLKFKRNERPLKNCATARGGEGRRFCYTLLCMFWGGGDFMK